MEAVGTERKPVECEVMREEAASLPTHSPFVTRLAASSFTHLFTHSFLSSLPTSLSFGPSFTRHTRSGGPEGNEVSVGNRRTKGPEVEARKGPNDERSE